MKPSHVYQALAALWAIAMVVAMQAQLPVLAFVFGGLVALQAALLFVKFVRRDL